MSKPTAPRPAITDQDDAVPTEPSDTPMHPRQCIERIEQSVARIERANASTPMPSDPGAVLASLMEFAENFPPRPREPLRFPVLKRLASHRPKEHERSP